MSYITLEDDNGDTMTLRDLDGFYIPPFPVAEADLRSMPDWSCRNGDVMISAYPKSGTHWVWELTSMMVFASEKYTVDKVFSMMEAISQKTFEETISPRVMNTHMYPKHLPKDFFKRKCKILLILRNPKDVGVSYYNHNFNMQRVYNYNGMWKNYLNRFLQGQVDGGTVFDYMDVWQKFIEDNPDYPIHVMYYEDLVENAQGEIQKMSEFLGSKSDNEFLQAIEKMCQFDVMKTVKEAAREERYKQLWRDEKPNMFRKGKVGNWKSWFTVSQNEMFENVIRERTKNSMFKFRYEIK